MLIVTDAWARTGFVWRTGVLDRHDVKEYQPAGYKLAGSRYADLGLEQLKDTPVISCTPAAATCRADSERFGAMRLTVDSAAPTTSCCGASSSRPGGSTPAFRSLPPSRCGWSRSPPRPARPWRGWIARALPIERWGWVISGVSLLLLAGLTVRERSSARG